MSKQVHDLIHFDVEATLKAAHETYIQNRINSRRANFERLWQKYEAAFRDYLDGMTGDEVAKKHSVSRQQIFELSKELNMPRADIMLLRRLAMRIKPRQMKEVNVCACFSCHWVRERRARIKSGENLDLERR